MTRNVESFLTLLRKRDYRKKRIDNDTDITELLKAMPRELTDTLILEKMLNGETPVLLEGDIFGFNRHQKNLPYYFDESGKKICDGPGNVTPNYARVIAQGYDALLGEIEEYKKVNTDGEAVVFYEAMERSVRASLGIADSYRQAAEREGNTRLAAALGRVPHKRAESFYEACVFMKFIIYTLRCTHATHLTLGRFDQYMLPYYEADIKKGVTREDLLESLELFFISLNLDTDIYFGLQQGDNGQSLVLGGFDKNGDYLFNELSELCMEASLDLCLIDPKINIRVGKNTPDRIYELGTKLTKKGLGFPQYCNDDLIIPYMMSLNYDEDDAYNYTVAACWEPLSPNNGYDFPNIKCFPFLTVTDRAIRTYLSEVKDFDGLMERVELCAKEKADEIVGLFLEKGHPEVSRGHNMYLSVFVDGCLEKGRDLTRGGAKYYNLGMLGAGISNAADALAAVKKVIFEDRSITADELFAALDANYEGYDEIRDLLLSAPKMGNNDEYVDSIAARLMNMAADNFHGRPNGIFGGVWRAGTGSAQNYINHSRTLRATADGRRDFEPLACSYSPALSTRAKGPLSVLGSFAKQDLTRLCNGGPLTMELHDTVFRNEEGEKKVAQLVKAFVMLGGHQLQLNSVNRETLLAAKEHPEEHQNLIVRVWGWSGYFCELDPEFQNHIISRTEYTM